MANYLTLKKSNCKNCHKCIRHCPVKSIKFSGNQAHILEDECILCGQCFVGCPQNAKEIVDGTEKVKTLLQTGEPVYVSLAPSFIANYNGIGINGMRTALKKLGFAEVEETAVGATIVKREYERIMREENRDVVITSCCHSVNLLIQKYFPHLLPYLADVMSPMMAHCRDIKRRVPNAKCVFIGPCLSKIDEAEKSNGVVDAAMTFADLTKWLQNEHVTLVPDMDNEEHSRARLFPTAGGVLKTMTEHLPEYRYFAIDGIDNCVSALKDFEAGKVHKCFIEMNACTGACINGPVMEKYHRTSLADYLETLDYAGEKDFEVEQPETRDIHLVHEPSVIAKPMPTEEEIKTILAQMGKTRPEHELNCGTCGYNSCRDKAVAIFQGKAEVSMCLPYLKDKAENFSDIIAKNTPNGLIVLNNTLEVQQINNAAMNILNLRSAQDILGDNVVRILDPTLYQNVLRTGRNAYNERSYLAEYNRYVDQTVIYDRDSHLIIVLMRDITEQEHERERKEDISRETVEVADRVVDKQMRIVQEIASLLGETAAETKIALAKLKESIKNE